MAKNSKVTDHDAAAHIQNPEAMPEFAGFEKEQISFPPYWEVAQGKWFYGMVIALDDRDEDFHRYVVQASHHPIECMQGSKEQAVPITVHDGEYFTLSTYSGLPLDRYIGVHVLVKCIGQKDTGKPQPMWEFELRVSPEDKKLLLEDRKARAGEAMAKFRESRKTQALPAHATS